ncbi:MAG: transporter substrate-binding domain-containing protein [Coleofasciculus sp. Co-bin14]|nr:transporter substrate-binding domain-containing protein [Coleofasciculus sp. Co-bin14]
MLFTTPAPKVSGVPSEGIGAITNVQTPSPETLANPAQQLTDKTDSLLLQLGSQGTKVKELQSRLKQLGYFKGEIDGVYEKTTELAILEFQKSLNLTTDGIVGSSTWENLQTTPSALPIRSSISPDFQRILERGKLVVALLGIDNPPFFMLDKNSELYGLDVKIAKSIAEQLDVKVEFVRSAKTFNEVVDIVYDLGADMAISKLSRSLSRAKKVRFSRPYLTMRHGLLVNRLQLAQRAKGRNTVEMIKQLDGKVGVIKGSSYVGFTKQKFPKATVVEYPSWNPDIINAVIRGDILAAYRDELEVKKIVLSNPDAALKFQTIALTDTQDSIAIALPWDSQHLLDFVNQCLETMKFEYTADTLLKEYSQNLQSS